MPATARPTVRQHVRVVAALAAAATLLLPAIAWSAFQIDELFLRCADGTPGVQYIEFLCDDDSQRTDSLYRVRAFDRTGAPLGEVRLHAQSGRTIPLFSNLLLGSSAFVESFLIEPDRALPFPLDDVGGRVDFVRLASATTPEQTIQSIPYGTASVPAPPAGFALGAAPGSAFGAVIASPRNLFGESAGETPCANADFYSGVRIQSFLTRCRTADDTPFNSSCFIELVNTGPTTPVGRGLSLRAFNGDGSLRLLVPDVTVNATGLWNTGQRLLMSPSPYWTQLDLQLAHTIDALGGRIELVEVGPAGDRPVQVLHYGPGGLALPPKGASLERDPGAPEGYRVQPEPQPITRSGETAWWTDCVGVCPASWISTLQGGAISHTYDDAGAVTSGSDSVSFDLRTGWLHVNSAVNSGVHTNDVFVLEGLPAGTPVTLEARWSGVAIASCGRWVDYNVAHAGGQSYSRTFTCTEPGLEDSMSVPVVAGTPFHMVLQAGTHGQPSQPSFNQAMIRARFAWGDLPPGARIVSCHGYDSGGPVATEFSLASAELREGVAHVRWFSAGGNPVVSLERIIEGGAVSGAWSPIARITADGEGFYAFVDRDIPVGTRVGYRLAWLEDARPHATPAVWIDITPRARFALHGLRPNPVAGASAVAFALDAAGDVRVELIDIAGRRVFERHWRLGPGEHVLPLAGIGEVPPGVYLSRLTQGRRSATSRAIVTR